MSEDRPQVSIIVPTRNEERNLPRLLDSVNRQMNVSCEVIVVDQESEDATAQLAVDQGARVINRERPAFYSPPAISRNVGAKEAAANVLLHLDADMELPDPEFISRFLSLFDDTHRAVIIHETDVARGWWNRVKAAERDCYWDTSLECARGVTKELFDEIGGYNEAISSGEDMYIQQLYASRTAVGRRHDVWLYHHTGKIPLRRLLAKKFNYGRTAKSFLDLSTAAQGPSATTWMRESVRAYVSHWRIAKGRPIEFACILPLRAMELIAVRIGMRKAARSG